jgi:hypothetical protein
MPNTYVALDQVTVSGTSTTTINFTNIPLDYTDLVIVVNCGISNPDYLNVRAGNGSVNTGSIYSQTVVEGNGSSATSSRGGNRTAFWASWTTTLMPTSVTANYIINIMNYSNTTTNKTFLSRGNVASAGVDAIVCDWNSTVAINTISLFANSQDSRYFLPGSTFSLYGIAAAPIPTAKATGGTITYGADGYTYHTFTAGGTFTPSSTLTCDALVVAGGGGGGANVGAGGGAGGLRLLESQVFTSATAYTVSIGGGGTAGVGGSGAGGAVATAGVNSSIIGGVLSIATSGGGSGGGGYTGKTDGGNGGSGGGSTYSQTYSTGNTGSYSPVEGFRGGIVDAALYGRASGGGGASQEGFSASAAGAGAGGAGVSSYNSIDFSIWLSATSKGVSGKLAGGGGGGNYNGPAAGLGGAGGGGNGSLTTVVGVAGTANTGGGGGGGGGDYMNGAAGGSGLVIIRYASV